MKVLSLFSGIGAFEKALSNLNIEHELVNYCEKDIVASKAYSLIHDISEDKNLGDITKINLLELPYYDLIVHGSPCQDFSKAGSNRGGEENSNTRSSLMWYSVKIVEKVKPKFVIWENVPQVMSSKNLLNFRKYLNRLIKFGYTSYYQILNSLDYNLPQNRKRIYCISIRNDVNFSFEFPFKMKLKKKLSDYLEEKVDKDYYIDIDKISILKEYKGYYTWLNNKGKFNTQCNRAYKNDYIGSISCDPGNNVKIFVKEATKKGYTEATIGDSINISYPNSTTRRGRVGKQFINTITTNSNIVVIDKNFFIRYPTPLECLRLQGFDDKDYEVLDKNGFTKRQLYKLAGNSIPVPVLEKIFYKLFIDRSTYQLSMYEFI